MTGPPVLGIWEAHELWVRSGRPYIPVFDVIATRNRDELRAVASVICIMVHRKQGAPFFVGGDSLGELFDVHGSQARRWLKQLEQCGIIRRTWAGGLFKHGRDGEPYRGRLRVARDSNKKPLRLGPLAPRASEYVFLGAPTF